MRNIPIIELSFAVLFITLPLGCGKSPEVFSIGTDNSQSSDSVHDTDPEENTYDACQDGKDNDKDGLTDCADDECQVLVVCGDETDEETDSTTGSDGDVDSDSDADSDADSDTDTDSDSDVDSDTDTDTDVDGDNDTDTDVDGDTDTDIDSDTDVDTDSDTDTDGDADTASETDTETDTNVNLSQGQDVAYFVNNAPVIDGLLSEDAWRLNSPIKKIVSGTTTNRAQFDVLWDETNLYVGVSVTDTKVCVDTEIESWNYDSVEIFIDPADNKVDNYDDKDVQMIFKYVDKDWVTYGDTTNNKAPVFMRGASAAGEYSVEMSIPWSGLGIAPSENLKIGFDVGVNDDDGTCGERDGIMRWWGTIDNYLSTKDFGDLIISTIQADEPKDSDTGTAPDSESVSDEDTGSETDIPLPPTTFAALTDPPPVIDGFITANEKWSLESFAEKVVSGTSENTVAFDTMWDETYLYAAIRVTDSKRCTLSGSPNYELDSVEIYLDPENNRSAPYDSRDIQMIMKYSDINQFEFGASTDTDSNRVEAVIRGRETLNGYNIEIAIPWSDAHVVPEIGAVIGFDIGVNDDDGVCGSRDGEIRWAGDDHNFESTVSFGILELVDSSIIDTDTDSGSDADAGP